MRFQGIVYRAHDPRWSWPPTSGEGARLHGGRFNRIGVPALYTSLSPVTALREVSPLRHRMQPLMLCSYEIDAGPVFDALDSRNLRAVTDAQLRCPDWELIMNRGAVPASQALADRLIAAGYVGIRVRSFAIGSNADDLNLVLWRWSDNLPSRVALIDDEHRLTEIRIRNVPEAMHRRLKARAAAEGVSMSQYVMAAVERALERPSRRELLAAIQQQPEVTLDPSPADVLRAERDLRGELLGRSR